MFPEMRRFKQQISQEECEKVLNHAPRGILSVQGTNGYPYGFPINFIYDSQKNKIYFHCAKAGYKLECLKQNPKVSFCVHDEGFRKENDWALNINSVIVFGEIHEVTNPDEILKHVRDLGLKYHPTVESVEIEIEKAISRVMCLELEIHHMTGKLVNES